MPLCRTSEPPRRRRRHPEPTPVPHRLRRPGHHHLNRYSIPIMLKRAQRSHNATAPEEALRLTRVASSSDLTGPAVNEYLVTGHEAGVVGGEEGDGLGGFLRAAQPPGGDVRGDFVEFSRAVGD